jgi:uncharacterized membrane protein
MVRRRSQPWIYRWSRVIIGAIAIVGALLTIYLTITKLTGGEAACLAGAGVGSNCGDVLNSKYAYIFGIPLSVFGLFAYISMATFSLSPLLIKGEEQKDLRNDLEQWTWLLLFLGSTAMAVFSGYLMSLLVFELKALCLYCVTSAISSTTMFIITLIGKEWEDSGQLFFNGVIVAMLVVMFALWHYNSSKGSEKLTQTVVDSGPIPVDFVKETPKEGFGWEIVTKSGESEIELAEHLTKTGAKMYGAFWCPHCHEQKLVLGKEATAKINYIECDAKGKNPQPELCVKAGIKGYPSWEINGKLESGAKESKKLAELSGYQGKSNFKYTLR